MAKLNSKSYRFTHVSIENWRNFSKVDIELERRVFLIGANASGKSNFLDIFRFLNNIVAVGGGLQQAVAIRGGVSNLRCLSAKRYSDILIKIQIEDFKAHDAWIYELCFNQDNKSRPYIRREIIYKNGIAVLNRPVKDDLDDPERLTQTHLEQVQVNQRFRPLSKFFSSISYRHIVPQLIREPDRSVGRNNDPYGGDFLEQIARTPKKTQTSRLRKINKALRVAVPQLKELELTRDVKGTPHLRGRYVHWRPKAGWQTEDVLSDGTLRLIGLLWAILDGSGPILLEEPELSLHSEIVRYIPQLFARIQSRSGRQIIVSTHSPDLLRDEGIGLNEVFLMIPVEGGTEIKRTADFKQIEELIKGGFDLAEAAIPETRPENVEQLPLFPN